MSKAKHAEAETVGASNPNASGTNGGAGSSVSAVRHLLNGDTAPFARGTEINSSVIHGVVTECWGGKHRP